VNGVNLAVVMDDAQAQGIADPALAEAWVTRPNPPNRMAGLFLFLLTRLCHRVKTYNF